jgi:hypothetical protein
MGALEERVPLDLLAAQSAMPRELLLTRLTKRLEDQMALTEEAARWAVHSWALALAVVTETDVKERERKLAKAVPPLTTTATARLNAEDRSGLKKSAEAANTQPPVSSPQQPRQQTARSQTPIVLRPPNAPAATPPKAVPSSTGGSILRQTPSAGPSLAVRTSPSPNAPQPQDRSFDPTSKKRRGKWRGCLIGCFLLVILSLLIFFIAPFFVSVLRQEQRQINSEPPRFPSQ